MEFEYSSAFYSSCFPNEHFDSKLFQRALDSFVPAVNSLAVANKNNTNNMQQPTPTPAPAVSAAAGDLKSKATSTAVVVAKKQKKNSATNVTVATANSIKKQKKTSKKLSNAIVVAAPQEDKYAQNLSRTAQDRLVWTEELHLLFLQVISELGDKAKPKEILQKMGIDGLTRGNVSSHLQKYKQRKERKVAPKKKTRATKVENEFHSKAPSTSTSSTSSSSSSSNSSSSNTNSNNKNNNSNNGNNGNNGSIATASTLSPTVIARSPTPVSVEEETIDSTPSPVSAPMEYTETMWYETSTTMVPSYSYARRASFSRAFLSDSDSIYYPPAPSPYFNSFSEYLAPTSTATVDDYFTYSNYYSEF